MEFQLKTNGANPAPQFVEFEVVYEDDALIPIEDTKGGMAVASSQSWALTQEVDPLKAGFMRFALTVEKTGLILGINDSTVTFTDSIGGMRTIAVRATLSKPGKKFK